MRIIAGEFRHRKLLSPPESAPTRPIPDRVKESLFGILRGHLQGATILDAFAGTGAIGLEALSRGAARVVFVEKHRDMARILEKNIQTLGAMDRTEVFQGDALGAGALARCPRPLTLAFFDPPYDLATDQLGLQRIKAQIQAVTPLLSPDGFVLFRTPWPCRHEIWPEGAEPQDDRDPDPRSRKRSPRKGDSDRRRGRTEHHRPDSGGSWIEIGRGRHAANLPDEDLDEQGDLETDDLDADAPEAPDKPDAAIKPTRVDADLTIPGVLGPETHAYGTMAIHFYARPAS